MGDFLWARYPCNSYRRPPKISVTMIRFLPLLGKGWVYAEIDQAIRLSKSWTYRGTSLIRSTQPPRITEAGSYSRLADSSITQLKAQGPSRTCNEREEKKDYHRSLGIGLL